MNLRASVHTFLFENSGTLGKWSTELTGKKVRDGAGMDAVTVKNYNNI